MAIISNEYREARASLADDPIVVAMAAEAAALPLAELVTSDGTPHLGFSIATLKEYRRRGGNGRAKGMGDVGYAIVDLLTRDGRAI